MKLIKPTIEHLNIINHFINDFDIDETIHGGSGIRKAANLVEWIENVNDMVKSIKANLVPSTTLIAIAEEQIIGIINIRLYSMKIFY